jgi:hypothetical protein
MKNTNVKTREFLTPEQALQAHNDGQNQEIKGRFVAREIYCNVNSLVEYCLKKGFEDSESPVTHDEIENFYAYPEYMGTYASFEGGTSDERDAEISRLKDILEELTENREIEDVRQSIEEIDENYGEDKVSAHKEGAMGGRVISDEYGRWLSNKSKAETIIKEIEDLEDLEEESQEVFEWWAVSSWLFEKLKEKGCVVVEAGSCHVWGRCTTGQAILLDGVIGRICSEMEILEGQRNSWAKV